MKRKAAFLLSILCVCLLSACGTHVESTEISAEEPYEITMELLVLAHNEDLQTVQEAVSAYTLKKINCTVKLKEVLFSEHENVLNRLSDNQAIDIIQCGYTTNPFDLYQQGVLLGIGYLLKTKGQDIREKSGILMDACYINDDYYFIPGKLYPCSRTALLYNQSLIEDNEIELPETKADPYDTILEFSENIKKSSYDGYPTTFGDGFAFSLPTANTDSFGNDKYTCGVLLNMETDTQIKNIYETEDFYSYCKYVEECYNKGYIPEDSLLCGDTVSSELINENIVFTQQQFSAEINTQTSIAGSRLSLFYLGNTTLTERSVSYESLGITTFSKNPEKCMEFLNLLYTDSTLSNLIMYGIEGVHYEKISEHIIDYPEGVSYSTSPYAYVVSSYGDESLSYKRSPATETDYANLQEFAPGKAVRSKAFGYTFDTEHVQQQIVNVNKVIDEYCPALLCGVVKTDEILPEFQQALKDAGIDEIISENQRQLDLWLSTQE